MLVREIVICSLDHRLVGSSIGAVVEGLPALLLNGLPLVIEVGLGNDRRAHTVRLEKNSELQLICRQRFKVVGPVDAGRAVGTATVVLHQNRMLSLADILGALKQHVLKEMGEAGSSWPLVARADIISDAYGIRRCAMILGEDNPETVFQSEFFEGDVEGPGRPNGGLSGLGFGAVEPTPGNNRQQNEQSRQKRRCCFQWCSCITAY